VANSQRNDLANSAECAMTRSRRGSCPAAAARSGPSGRRRPVARTPSGGRFQRLAARGPAWWAGLPSAGQLARLRLGRRQRGDTERCQSNGSAHDAADASIARQRKNPGDDLFSRKAALSVSSALESLTSVFGMGTGVASPLESPGSYASGSQFAVRIGFPSSPRELDSVSAGVRCNASRRCYAVTHRRSSISCCVQMHSKSQAPNPW
jgi:hypothetical protein